jgi:hypothetical protein
VVAPAIDDHRGIQRSRAGARRGRRGHDVRRIDPRARGPDPRPSRADHAGLDDIVDHRHNHHHDASGGSLTAGDVTPTTATADRASRKRRPLESHDVDQLLDEHQLNHVNKLVDLDDHVDHHLDDSASGDADHRPHDVPFDDSAVDNVDTTRDHDH